MKGTRVKRPRLGRKTGPKPQFSVSDIAECALKIGLDRFTIGQVAKELGVVPSAIYRHVENRDEIVMRGFARSARLLQAPSGELSWQEILRHEANEMWEMFERYPGLANAVSQTPGAHVHLQQYFADMTQTLLAADFPGDRGRALFAIDFVGDIVLSSRIFIENVRAENEDGLRGIDQARQLFSDRSYIPEGVEPIYPPDDSWLGRDSIDNKVEFVIAALGVLPPHPLHTRQ